MGPIRKDELENLQSKIDDMDAKLTAYVRAHCLTKKGNRVTCNSEKHHQWRHYALQRATLGEHCDERSFEHFFGVGFKKPISKTNSSADKSEQAADYVHKRTVVHHLCQHGGVQPPAKSGVTPRARSQNELGHKPMALGLCHLDCPHAHRIMQAKAQLLPGQVVVSDSMHVQLANRQLSRNHPNRVQQVMLQAGDHVRVWYAGGGGAAVGFGKCLAFLRDASQSHHVYLQWCFNANRVQIDRVAKLHKVRMGVPDRPGTFEIVPAMSVLNGALVVPLPCSQPQPDRQKLHFVLQSHREATSLVRLMGS